jgi:hypothetical protein
VRWSESGCERCYVRSGDHLGWITQWHSMSNLPLISFANFSIPPCDRSVWLPIEDFPGSKQHGIPVHHLLERILDEYIVVVGPSERATPVPKR